VYNEDMAHEFYLSSNILYTFSFHVSHRFFVECIIETVDVMSKSRLK